MDIINGSPLNQQHLGTLCYFGTSEYVYLLASREIALHPATFYTIAIVATVVYGHGARYAFALRPPPPSSFFLTAILLEGRFPFLEGNVRMFDVV